MQFKCGMLFTSHIRRTDYRYVIGTKSKGLNAYLFSTAIRGLWSRCACAIKDLDHGSGARSCGGSSAGQHHVWACCGNHDVKHLVQLKEETNNNVLKTMAIVAVAFVVCWVLNMCYGFFYLLGVRTSICRI